MTLYMTLVYFNEGPLISVIPVIPESPTPTVTCHAPLGNGTNSIVMVLRPGSNLVSLSQFMFATWLSKSVSSNLCSNGLDPSY